MQLFLVGRRLVAAIALVVAGLFAITAVAEPAVSDFPGGEWRYAVSLGVMAHDVDLNWAYNSRESGTDYNVEVLINRSLYDDVPFGVIRPGFGVSINDRGDTSRIYAGALWQIRLQHNLLFNVGIGLALHDGVVTSDNPEDKQLGSRVLFRLPLELGYEINSRSRVFLSLEHMSNGSLANPNQGMDVLGFRYRYRFK